MNNANMAGERSTEELLAEILKYQKKQSRRAGVTAFAHFLLIVTLLAVLAAGILLLPRVLAIVGQAEDVLNSVQTLTRTAEEAVREAGDAMSSIGSLAEDNAQNLAEAVEKLNGIDFNGLNDAIRDLHDAVKPLGELGRQVP